MEELLLEAEENELKVGDKVTGTVVSVSDSEISLDIGSFTEGVMHLDKYINDKSVTSFKGLVKVGDKINCEVAKIVNDEYCHIYLSRRNQMQEENFKAVEDACADGSIIEVKIVSAVKDNKGFNASYKGNTLFMPKSQATQEVQVGKTIEVKVLEVEAKRQRAIISRRVIEQEEFKENRANELDSINVGDVLTGKIAKVEKYGAIVRFNFAQGLLKANQVSHQFVDITKELAVGQDIEVKVVSKENGKLELSRKALLKTPFEEFAETHKVGEKITGKVVNKLAFGLLLEVGENIKGLLHQSEYSHNPNDNFNNCVIIGDMVEVAILDMKAKGEKISLSRKALMDNPWEKVEAKEGDITEVKVTEVKDNGLIVEAFGVDGFIPASESMLEDKKDAPLSSYFAAGDTAKATVLEINPKEWKLKLSIKKVLKAEERKSFEKYLNDEQDTNATLGDMFADVLNK